MAYKFELKDYYIPVETQCVVSVYPGHKQVWYRWLSDDEIKNLRQKGYIGVWRIKKWK